MITRTIRKNFFKKIIGNTIALFMMVMTAVPMPALAIIYSPGATLNPSCLPTDTTCGVTPPATTSTSTPTTAVAFNGTSTTTPSTFAYATSTNFEAQNATSTNLAATSGVIATLSSTLANITQAIIDTLTARVATIYGLTVGTLTATSTAQFLAGASAPFFTATSTTATSTFAGPLSAGSLKVGTLSGLLFSNAGTVASFATTTATAGQVLGISGGNLTWLTQSGGSGATTTMNGVNGPTFTFGTGTTGTDFNIATSTGALTWNIPDASATARGLISTTTQTFAGDKTFNGALTFATTTVSKLFTASQGITIASSTPLATANTLYNEGGALKWNGGAVVGQPTVANWPASTAVVAGELRLVTTTGSTVFNTGQLIRSNSARTTGTGFSSTEASNWTAVGDADPSVVKDWAASTFVFTNELRTATAAAGGFQIGQTIKSVSNRTTGATFDATEADISKWVTATKQNGTITDWAANEVIYQNEVRRAISASGLIKSGDLIRNTIAGSRITSSTFSSDVGSWIPLISTPQAILPWAASTVAYPGEMRVAPADAVTGIRMGDIIYDSLAYTRTTGATFDITEAALWVVAHKVSSKARVWVASSPVEADEIRTATVAVGGFQAGQLIKSNSARTTTVTFDATEASNWTSVATHLGSLSGLLFSNNGALASFATSTATAGQVLGISGGNLAWLTQSGGSGATTTMNGVNGPTFTFGTGTTGTDFNIATSTGALTWNLPNASATARGLVSTTTQTFAGDKTFSGKLFLTQGTATSSLIGMTSGGTRMRLTSGTSDTQDNDQGASVDLHTVAAGGGLDFVAGRGGALNFWTSTSTQTAQQRMILTRDGNLGIGTMTPAQQLSLSNSLRLENTSTSSIGVIYKGLSPFLHNFISPTGNGGSLAGQNTFLGVNSGNFTMGNNASQFVSSSYNTGIGVNALSSNDNGQGHTAIGYNALLSNVNGTFNTAIGAGALASSTTGSLNAANGYYALASNVGGSANTANGAYALYSNTSGNYNSAYGQGALYFNTTGGSNVALGYQTGRYIADGTSANATSSNSLYLGSNVRALASGDTNEIVIGNSAVGLGSNTAVLGNASTTLTYLGGNVTIGTTTPASSARLLVAGFTPTSGYNIGLNSGNGSVSTTTVSGQTIITYSTTGSSTFTPPTGVTSVEYLVVGAGGGGGEFGGGGGAGGMLAATSTVSGLVTITVGAGGAGSTARAARGSNGGNSVFDTVIVTGGGGGGSDNNASTNTAINNGALGGSGGGGSYFNSSPGGAGTANQGSTGGSGNAGSFTSSGGGGGAGAVGGNGNSSSGVSGTGGAGTVSTITGSSVTYAGGGGGGGGTSGGAGGAGGGGQGNNSTASTAGTNGLGGGGGGGTNTAGSAGGSGVVIVRFATVITSSGTNASQAILRVTDTGTNSNGTLAFFDNSVGGQACVIMGSTGLSCSSDITLKKHINPLGDSLGNVLALKAVTYDWKNGASDTEDEAGVKGSQIGFIAQDVEKIFPGLVVTDPNGKKALAYDRFAPILTKAIQEISAKIDKFFTVLENGWRRLTADELCLTDSSGAQVCVTGDQLRGIGGAAPQNNADLMRTNAEVVMEPAVTATTTTADTNVTTSMALPVVSATQEGPTLNTDSQGQTLGADVVVPAETPVPTEAPVTATVSTSAGESEPTPVVEPVPAPTAPLVAEPAPLDTAVATP